MEGLAGGVSGEPLLDVGEVVAERVVAALLADVVGVEAGLVVRGGKLGVAVRVGSGAVDAALLVALLDLVDAGRSGVDHRLVRGLGDGLDAVGVVVRHLGVVSILHLRSGEAVSDSDSGEVELDVPVLEGVVALEDPMRDGRGVVAAVRLSEDEERLRGILRVRLEEVLQEIVRILSDHDLVAVIGGAVGEANAGGLVQPQDVGVVVP
mmetsp:Transcript_24496/g.48665  ORF Transcript_24496/g.48665 Transcript_24496/m.48665 type:complete len:208 (+) Transcript_24496:912-1535(+)